MQTNDSILDQKIGALYIRVSTDRQEELSPDAQIRLGRNYAKEHNIYIPEGYIFQDDGISGKKADRRPQFKNLIGFSKSKDHPIDCILVWKFSRFARNQEESIVYKSLLKQSNVDVISISEPIIEGPFGVLLERIIEWMDEYYLINLSTEVVRGMTENAMRGQYQSSPPIGYKHGGHNLPPVKDPDMIHVPLEIVDMFLNDSLSLLQISRKINDLGYRTKRGNLFDPRGIRYILENPFYTGTLRWNYSNRNRQLKEASEVIYVDGGWEPLYGTETYDAICNRLSELDSLNSNRGRAKRDVASCQHWLSGLLFCSSCGRTLSYSGNDKNKAFQCWAYGKAQCNESHYISTTVLERYIIQGLEQFLYADRIDYAIVYKTVSNDKNLRELNHILSRLSEKEKRIKDAYVNGIDSMDEYRENKLLIKSETEKIEEQIASLVIPPKKSIDYDAMMIHNLKDVLDILKDEGSDYIQKGNSLRSVCDKIIFNRKTTSFDFYLKLVV